WRLLTGSEKRYAYLASREWGLLREAIKERSGGICERCHKNWGTAVHHLTYARLYCERLEDLIHLCDECHDFHHGRSNFDPAAPTPTLTPTRINAEERARQIREETARIEAERVATSTPALVAPTNERDFVPIYYYNSTWRILLQDGAYLFSLSPYIDVVILNRSNILCNCVLFLVSLDNSKWMKLDKPAILSIPEWDFERLIKYANYIKGIHYSAVMTRISCKEEHGQVFMDFGLGGSIPAKNVPLVIQRIDGNKWIKSRSSLWTSASNRPRTLFSLAKCSDAVVWKGNVVTASRLVL